MPQSIVVLDPIGEIIAGRLRALLPDGFALSHATARGDEHMKSLIADADYAICGQVAVSGDVLRAAQRLKLLHKWGVGVDNIDLAAARDMGIRVARTTGSNAVPVAEFTVGLILSALRNIAFGHAELRQGEWRGERLPQDPFMLSGKTVGIVGFGAIGQRLARLLRGFECRVLYTKRTRLPSSLEAELGASYASLSDLLAASDIVTLHCPLTAETAGLIDRSALETMKRTAVLVNVARGGVVKEDDLVWALSNRIIHAAATDVFEIEPVPPSHPLLRLDNCTVTPHLAARAADNFARAVTQMYENILRVAHGEPLPEADAVVP